MSSIIEITDLSAPELEAYTQLTHAQLRNRLEPEKGIFIAESTKVIACALKAGCQPVSALMERNHIDSFLSHLPEDQTNIPIYTADREVLEGLTGYQLTRGVLCAMRRPVQPSVEELCRSARRIAVLENITDATNVGAIFRSAAALGMDGVLVTPCCCDPLYRRADVYKRQAQARTISELMAQLANENRLLLLCALMEGPMMVGELAAEVPNITAPALSQHLHRLKEGGLVQAEKQGQYVRYSLKDPRLYALMRVLKHEYCTSDGQ